MATSKVLQAPSVIEIIGSTIRIGHPTIKGNTQSFLLSPIASGGTAMVVGDNNYINNSDYILVGSVGDTESEEVAINGAVTRGQSLTVANTLKFDHEQQAPIAKIFERGIRLYGAATVGGVGTLIASVNAITTPIADAVMIQWNRPYTEWTLISTDTAYAYYYAIFTDDTTDSGKSVYVPASGVPYNSVKPLIDSALLITDSEVDDKELTWDMLIGWAQNCQEAISQFTYQDPQTAKYCQKDWDFEIAYDNTSIVAVENENEYTLTLDPEIKYPNSDKAIIDVKIGVKAPMVKVSIDDFDDLMEGRMRTNTSVTANIGDTTLNVVSTSDFNDEGSLMLGTDTLTYTGKTATTFTGIPASGSGSITAIHALGSAVWQNITAGEPQRYVIFNGKILLDVPVSSDFAGQNIKVRYLCKLDRITKLSDSTVIPFTNTFQYFIASKIEARKQAFDKSKYWMDEFNKQVTANAQASYTPVVDTFSYYNYRSDLDPWDESWDSMWWGDRT